MPMAVGRGEKDTPLPGSSGLGLQLEPRGGPGPYPRAWEGPYGVRGSKCLG